MSTPAKPPAGSEPGDGATASPAPSSVAVPVGVPVASAASRRRHATHDAWLLRYGEPVAESVATLRLAVPAARALAALGEALARSPLRDSAIESFALLDAAAGLAFDGRAADARAVLGDPDGREAGAARRGVEARREAVLRGAARDPDIDSVVALASALSGAPAVLRDREPSVHERASLAPGQRLPRGRERVERGLRAWLDFLVRSAGEAEPLIVVGEAYRRLLALRPFARGNLGLAQALAAVLLELEGPTAGWTLPLGHRLLGRRERHAERLAAGEGEPDAWLAFWLESVRACASDAHAALRVWERHRDAVAGVASAAVRGPLDPAVLEALSRPGLSATALVRAGLTRHAAKHALDALEEASLVQDAGTGRTRRHVARDVLDALVG